MQWRADMKLDEYPNLKDRIGELDEGAASWQSSSTLRNVTAAAIVIVVVLFLREQLDSGNCGDCSSSADIDSVFSGIPESRRIMGQDFCFRSFPAGTGCRKWRSVRQCAALESVCPGSGAGRLIPDPDEATEFCFHPDCKAFGNAWNLRPEWRRYISRFVPGSGWS